MSILIPMLNNNQLCFFEFPATYQFGVSQYS